MTSFFPLLMVKKKYVIFFQVDEGKNCVIAFFTEKILGNEKEGKK